MSSASLNYFEPKLRDGIKLNNPVYPDDESYTRTGKVYQYYSLTMPKTATIVQEIVVIEPCGWSEVSQALTALRELKIVILKLSELEPNQAQRAADFVTGGTYALNGHTQRIGEQTFLFTPRCVQVSNQGQSAVLKNQE